VWIVLAPLAAIWARLPVLRTTVVVAATVWGADLIAQGIKTAVGRPRPFQVLPDADPLIGATVGTSFPSGHAVTSAAGAILLAALLPRRAWPWLALLAATIAFSRVYAGVHYPSDVLAGLVLGAVAALVAIRLLRLTSGDPRRREAAPRRG
jgi:membrane-associated phospholipid phosphatase